MGDLICPATPNLRFLMLSQGFEARQCDQCRAEVGRPAPREAAKGTRSHVGAEV